MVRFLVTCLEISFCLVHARIFCFIIARLCKETSDEINRIERRKAMVTKEINKLKNNLQAFKQTGQDVKFLTDRLLHKVVRFWGRVTGLLLFDIVNEKTSEIAFLCLLLQY